MGVYDTFGKNHSQLKSGPCEMKTYQVGDVVPLEDGVHVAYEAVIVVQHGKFIAEFPHLITKYGGIVSCESILNSHNHVVRAMRGVVVRHGDD